MSLPGGHPGYDAHEGGNPNLGGHVTKTKTSNGETPEPRYRETGAPETPTTTSPTSPPVDPDSGTGASPETLEPELRERLEAQRDRHADPLGLREDRA